MKKILVAIALLLEYFLRFRPRGTGGLPYIIISFFSSSATMDITLDNGKRLTLDGEIKSIRDSGVFKGQAIF